MFIVPLPLILALQRSAMCFRSIELHVAPNGATSFGFVRGYKHFAPPEQRILWSLLAFRAKLVQQSANSGQRYKSHAKR